MRNQPKAVGDRSAGRDHVNRASRLTPTQHGHSDAFTEVVELLADEGGLDAVDLVCLGSCSRAHRAAAEAVLQRRAMFLLLTAVQQAAAAKHSINSTNQQKSTIAVEELLRGRKLKPGLLTAPTAAAEFISISNVPQRVVTALMQAGLRFNFEQLMQAVRARTAGVEVWVTATAGVTLPRVKGVQTAKWASLPPWVKKLCTADLVSSILTMLKCQAPRFKWARQLLQLSRLRCHQGPCRGTCFPGFINACKSSHVQRCRQ
jgi:hypothetical protein